MAQPLQLIDENGEIVRSSCSACNDHLREVESLKRSNESLFKEILDLRKERDALRESRKERDRRARETYKQRARVERLFQRWQEILGKKNCKLGDRRFDAIRAMIGLDYTDEQFEMAFYGAKQYAYRNPKTGQVHNDIEFICRNEANFERFANLGAAAVRALKRQMEAQDA
jgi:predicted RNase H-like nuclease (RuvC/YqgF family)